MCNLTKLVYCTGFSVVTRKSVLTQSNASLRFWREGVKMIVNFSLLKEQIPPICLLQLNITNLLNDWTLIGMCNLNLSISDQIGIKCKGHRKSRHLILNLQGKALFFFQQSTRLLNLERVAWENSVLKYNKACFLKNLHINS